MGEDSARSEVTTAVANASSDNVLSDCDELQSVFSNLSVSDLNSELHTTSVSTACSDQPRTADDFAHDLDGELVRTLTEDAAIEMRKKKLKIKFAAERTVCITKKRDRPEDFGKCGYRQTPNPWRRHGAVKTLHQVGGWCSKNKKDRNTAFVKPGSHPPKAPNHPHISLHHDPDALEAKLFCFVISRQQDGTQCANSIADQIAGKCENLEINDVKKSVKTQKKTLEITDAPAIFVKDTSMSSLSIGTKRPRKGKINKKLG
ncbi:unnamed protein product [Bursaphelenchus xylophilus]|nr:unnamed protein product [Bursaphelenchus xylophilus]CAG9102493.1 unnamed protein product [Bursaphelenchus xylophilus]